MALTTSRQLRAARAMLGWDQRQLAEVSDVSNVTIGKMEQAEGILRGRHETVQKLQRALEQAGVEFTNGDKPGVRMREPTAA
jgi:predicted transcriptional regulator